MIPKIIHYSWFSGDPYPEPVRLYMETWKRVLPDYEFVLWDMERAKEIDAVFFREAIQERKWAFAADYLRCYAVYKYGGIWLDTDVELFQSLDSFLGNRCFIGKEGRPLFNIADSFRYIYPLTAHCFGAEKGHPFIHQCVEYYHNRHFVTSVDHSLPESLRYDMKLLPEIMSILANSQFGYDGGLASEEDIEHLDGGISIFPYYVFDLPRYHNPNEVFAIHYQVGGWVNGSSVTSANRGFRKKGWKYYLYYCIEKLLKRKKLKLNFLSF